MPGAASLAAGQYYAHPRNAFWPIMGELFGAAPQLDYTRRVAALKAARVAVWDVLHSCVREGSLDSSIAADSLAVNDLAGFLRRHRGIRHVFFNGGTAESVFRRSALPTLSAAQAGRLSFRRLPSTSPANAGSSVAQKLAAWRAVSDALAELGKVPAGSGDGLALGQAAGEGGADRFADDRPGAEGQAFATAVATQVDAERIDAEQRRIGCD